MKKATAAAQKKAEGSIQKVRVAATIAAESPVATAGGSELRVSMTGDSAPAYTGLETERSLQMKEAERRTQLYKWRFGATQIIVSLVCLALAGYLYFDTKLGDRRKFIDFPVDRWLITVAIVPPVYAVCAILANLLLMLAEVFFDHVQHVHYVVLGLAGPLSRFLTAAVLCGLIRALEVDYMCRGEKLPDGTQRCQHVLVAKFLLCFLIYSSVALVTKLGCRLLSLRVHAKSLFSKLKKTVDQEQILSQLMVPPEAGQFRADLPNVRTLAAMRDVPPAAVEGYLRDLHRMSLSPPYKSHESFAEQLIRLTWLFESMTEEELDQHAHYAAEYLWCTARPDPAAAKLFKADFEAILGPGENADFAYELFDLDGDGFVVETEVHERFESIYRHRRHIANTLMDTNSVIVTLESLIGGILHVIATFAYLAIFNVDVTHLVLSFSSVAVAFAFVFGNSLREVYESVVWLFGVNPYDAGDCLWYSGTFATVDKFGLLNTQLVLTNGSRVWVPNQKLMNSGVTNLSDSKPVAVYMEVEVDASVSPEAVDELSRRMKETAAEYDDLFDQTFEVGAHIQNVVSPLKYQVELCYKCNATMMQYAKYCETRAVMNQTIGQWVQEHNVMYSAAFQQAYATGQ